MIFESIFSHCSRRRARIRANPHESVRIRPENERESVANPYQQTCTNATDVPSLSHSGCFVCVALVIVGVVVLLLSLVLVVVVLVVIVVLVIVLVIVLLVAGHMFVFASTRLP